MAALSAVFLDRDGTLNVPAAPGEYVTRPEHLHLLAGAADAVARLRAAGHLCVVVSNQRGVALGLMDGEDLAAVDARLHELVGLDASLYCTHGLEEGCPCRKPAPGLLHRAAAELDIDLARSWMVGDAESDVAAGRAAGCRTLRVEPRDGALRGAAEQILDLEPVGGGK